MTIYLDVIFGKQLLGLNLIYLNTMLLFKLKKFYQDFPGYGLFLTIPSHLPNFKYNVELWYENFFVKFFVGESYM